MLLPFLKKIAVFFFACIAVLFLVPGTVSVQAQTKSETSDAFIPELIVFVRETCQHCADEKKFLGELAQQDPNFSVTYLDLADQAHYQTWLEFTTRTKTSKVTPITVVGETVVVGFGTPETTGKTLIKAIETARTTQKSTNLNSITEEMAQSSAHLKSQTCDENEPCTIEKEPTLVPVPFFGTIDVSSYPLVLLASVLGFIDGFNPCAMWVLITFLIMLLKIGSRRKMFVFAGIFILAETIMYYTILMVWFKTWDFVQLDAIVTPIVGVVAIGGGLFFLYESRKAGVECHITSLEQQQKTRQRLQNLVSKNFSLLTVLGILGVAFSVNVIEFACSIGIPQTFTKILEMNNLGWMQSQLLVLLYILFYMIDDFIVFGIALYAFDKLAVSTKYVKISNIVGGLLMIGLGLIMLINPSLLLF